MPDLKRFVGIPFVDGGRDPETGLDCWGLFLAVQKALGNDIPDFCISCFDGESILAAYEEEVEKWEMVDKPEIGCGVAMTLDDNMPRCVQHFGVYIGDRKFIHALKGINSCVSRIDDLLWKNRIVGFYRWKG